MSTMLGTLTISMALRTVGAVQSMNAFEKGITASIARINMKIAGLGRTFSYGLAAPLGLLGFAAGKTFAEFEESLIKIETLVGRSRAEVSKWQKDIIQMAPTVAKNPKELADALYYITSAEPRMEQELATDILRKSAMASAAGLGEMSEIAKFATSAINAYGKENLNAAQATDVLVAGVREGQIEAEEFAKGIGEIVPFSSRLEVDLGEVVAALASMSRTGTPATKAVTFLKNVLFSLDKETPKVATNLRALGLNYDVIKKKLSDPGGLLDVLRLLDDETRKQGLTLADVFPRLRAYTAAADITGKNLKNNIVIFEKVNEAFDTGGDMLTAYERAMDTFSKRWQQAIVFLQTRLMGLGKSINQAILPIFNALINKIGSVLDWFNNLSAGAQKTVIQLGFFATALGPVLIVLSSLISVMEGIIAVFAFLSGPVGMVLALAAAAALVVSNFKEWQISLPKILDQGNLSMLKFYKTVDEGLSSFFNGFHIKLLQVKKWIFTYLQKPFQDAIKIMNSFLPENWAIEVDMGEDVLKEIDDKIKELQEGTTQNAFSKYFEDKSKQNDDLIKDLEDKLADPSNYAEGAKTFEEVFGNSVSIIKSKIVEVLKGLGIEGFDTSGFGKLETETIASRALRAIKLLKQRLLKAAEDSQEEVSIAIPMEVEIEDKSLDQLAAMAERVNLKINKILQKGVAGLEVEANVNDLRDLREQLAEINTQMERLSSSVDLQTFVDPFSALKNELKEIEVTAAGVSKVMSGGITEEGIDKLKRLAEQYRELQNRMEIVSRIADGLTDSIMAIGEAIKNQGDTWKKLGDIAVSVITDIIRMLLKQLILQLLTSSSTEQQAVSKERLILKEQEELWVKSALTGVTAMETAALELNTKAKRENAIASGINAAASGVETGAKAGEAVANATASGAKLPPPFNIIAIALGVAAVLAAISQVSKARKAAKMASGGVVPGGYPNDTYPAMLSSGEIVVPPKKLPELERGVVVLRMDGDWRIKGRDLYYILREEERVISNSF